MEGGISLGRILGIEIRIDWSWLFIFLLIVWNLSASFAQVNPDWGFAVTLMTAIAAALLFFISVLLHELAHSLMAIRQGLTVRSITLFLFGGVSNIQREPPSPRAEFWITIVGPLTSFVLSILFLMLASLTIDIGQATQNVNEILGNLNPISVVVLWLATINMILAVFNLIPGFPLDGGRILRAVLWGITNDLRKATRWAAWVGQVVAWLLIFSGIAMIFGVRIPFFGTGFIGGLWLAFIGWFLNGAAAASYQQVVIHDILKDIPVRAIMLRNPPTVEPQITVDSLVHDHVMQRDDYGFPVVDGERLLGLVTLTDVRSIVRDAWSTTTVREIMTPIEQLITVQPEDDMSDALRTLTERDLRQLPIVRGDLLQGLLRRRDIMKWLNLQAEIRDGNMAARTVVRQG